MKSVTASLALELKDLRALDIIKNYPDINIYSQTHVLIGQSWILDRTQSVQLPFCSTVLPEHQLPDFTTIAEYSLSDLCIRRAAELISTNRQLYFFWSGGIDSTLGLVSFLKLGIPLDQITVVCNNDSIRENLKFYQDHIRGKFKLISSELMMQKMKTTQVDGIIVSSEHGDLMYGQDFGHTMFEMFGTSYLREKPTRETITKFFRQGKMSDQAANCWYDLYMESAKQSPRPIDTTYDFSWWAGFNWRWQWAKEKIKIRTAIDLDIRTFFSTYEFQKWSVNHMQSDMTTKRDIKIEFKNIILDYTQDQGYFDTKIKHPSVTMYYGGNSFVAIDGNGSKIKADNFTILDYYQKDNFISNWLKS